MGRSRARFVDVHRHLDRVGAPVVSHVRRLRSVAEHRLDLVAARAQLRDVRAGQADLDRRDGGLARGDAVDFEPRAGHTVAQQPLHATDHRHRIRRAARLHDEQRVRGVLGLGAHVAPPPRPAVAHERRDLLDPVALRGEERVLCFGSDRIGRSYVCAFGEPNVHVEALQRLLGEELGADHPRRCEANHEKGEESERALSLVIEDPLGDAVVSSRQARAPARSVEGCLVAGLPFEQVVPEQRHERHRDDTARD